MDFETASRHYEALVDDYLRAPSPGAAARTAWLFAEPVRTAFVVERAAEPVIEGMLWAAWSPVVRAARASRGAVQRDLVGLLGEIRGIGALTRDGGRTRCVIWGGLTVFGDLPCFGAQLREAWDADGQGSTESEVNLNAFAARLTAHGMDFSLYAIWTLRQCLEDTAAADLRAVIPWMRHCGPMLARLARQRRSPSEPDRGPARLGPLARGGGVRGGGVTVERWAFWRGRLAELAAGTGAVAHQARTALELMPALEDRTWPGPCASG